MYKLFFTLGNFSSLLKSFFKLGFYVCFSKKAQILFYYPHHFNRSVGGKNEYFEPWLRICKKNKISYLLMEEPALESNQPRNMNATPSDAFFYYILLFRKILTLLGVSFWKKEKIMALILNVLTFNKFKVANYITISGNMQELFQCMNTKAKVFDMQHGIIYSSHSGYFDSNGKLRELLSNENLHFLVSGNGYKKCFNRYLNNDDIMHKIHVIGTSSKVENYSNTGRDSKTILFSLQFVSENSMAALSNMKRIIWEAIAAIDTQKYQVLLKHHPRFNNDIDLTDLFLEFPGIKVTNVNFEHIVSDVFLHVTINSTTTFEYAEYGIPTYLLNPNEDLSCDTMFFYKEYGYPLYFRQSLENVLTHLEDKNSYLKDGERIENWYNEFYAPIDEIKFLNIIN